MSKMGRPSKFSPELGGLIVEDVAKGLYLKQIADKHDLHTDTIKNWVRIGLEENAPQEYVEFATKYRRADATAMENSVARVRRGALRKKLTRLTQTERVNAAGEKETSETNESRGEPGDWRAEAWFAERRWPKVLGSRRPGGPAGEMLAEDLDTLGLQDAADSRSDDLDELLAEPPPELEEALLRNKDKLLALLGKS